MLCAWDPDGEVETNGLSGIMGWLEDRDTSNSISELGIITSELRGLRFMSDKVRQTSSVDKLLSTVILTVLSTGHFRHCSGNRVLRVRDEELARRLFGSLHITPTGPSCLTFLQSTPRRSL